MISTIHLAVAGTLIALLTSAQAEVLTPGQETCKQRKLDRTCLGPCQDHTDSQGRVNSSCPQGFTATLSDTDVIIRHPSPEAAKVIKTLKASKP